MKKIIALALSLILVLSLSVIASAESYSGTVTAPAIPDTPVSGTYTEGTGAVDTYSVEISWTGLAFTFAAAQKTWDATNHVEVDATEGQWSSAGTITVKNHSNVGITATPSYDPGSYDGDATIGVSGAINLNAATEGTENYTQGTITVTPGGTLEKSQEAVDLGDIVIVITKYVAQQG